MRYTTVCIKYICASIFTLSTILPAGAGYALDITPFLYLPFSKTFQTGFTITEGRWYSGSLGSLNLLGTGEYFIHGLKSHHAIDYGLPYGTPVFAPMDGYVIASYQDSFLKENNIFRLYQGTKIHYGWGWHVQIWNPEKNVFVLLAHLSSIDETLPVSPPFPYRGKGGTVNQRVPTGVTSNTAALQTMIANPSKYPGIVKVKRGQRIGTVGVSGVERNDAMPVGLTVPRWPSKVQPVSWDEPHIHMEVFTVVDGEKVRTDPYKIYHDYRGYPDSNTVRKTLGIGKTLFRQDTKGRFLHANEGLSK